MPPMPKHPSTRQRRNKTSTVRTLSLAEAITKAPELPAGRDWHAQTSAWWGDVWASPMAPEYDDSDRHGLFLLAVLVDDFWRQPSQALAAEIRLQRQCFGLSPIDRRRLQWEIQRGEDAVERRQARKASPAPTKKTDPRKLLAG